MGPLHDPSYFIIKHHKNVTCVKREAEKNPWSYCFWAVLFLFLPLPCPWFALCVHMLVCICVYMYVCICLLFHRGGLTSQPSVTSWPGWGMGTVSWRASFTNAPSLWGSTYRNSLAGSVSSPSALWSINNTKKNPRTNVHLK